MVKSIEQVKEMWQYTKPLMERDFGINLDYSISSIFELEKILHILKNAPTDHSYSVLIFGFYLGETIINNYEEAKWDTEYDKLNNVLDYHIIIKKGTQGVGVDVYELMAALFNKRDLPSMKHMFASLDETVQQLDTKKVKTISTGEPSTLGTYRNIAKIISGSSNSIIVKYFDKCIADAPNGEKQIIHEGEEKIMFAIGKSIYEEKISLNQYK